MRLLRVISVLGFAVLLLLSQVGVSAHASSFGDTPHDHDGVMCDVALLGEEMEALLPPAPIALPAPRPDFVVEYLSPSLEAPRLAPPARAPPPRAPPADHR